MAENEVVYRYFAVNIVTNQVIGELPLTGVSYERALKDAGSFSGTLSLSQEVEGVDVYNATMPGKIAIYVLRNGECVWGGPIWSRNYDVVGKTVSISANEFTSYYQHRKIWKTWNLTHSGTVVYVDPKNINQLIVELNKDTDDTITIDEGVAVELSFSDKKGYNLNGHFRVNKDYRNATKITLDKEALQWNVFGVDHTFKTTKDAASTKIDVAKRVVTAGSGEITITTETPHGLGVGDEVSIEGMDSALDNTVTIYKSLEGEYAVAALASTSTIYRYGNVTANGFNITGIDTRGISKGAKITQIADGANTPGVMPTQGFECVVEGVYDSSDLITFSSYVATSKKNTPASRSGKVYLKFENQKPGYSARQNGKNIEYTIQPKDTSWMGKLKDGYEIKTNGMKSYGTDATDKIFGELAGANNFHKILRFSNPTNPQSMGQYTYLKLETDYVGVPTITFSRKGSIPAGYKPPIVDATFTIIKLYSDTTALTKSRPAKCANGNGQPVIRVIDRKTFVVNSGCEAEFDNTSTDQPDTKIAWDGKYQATMYTHTDTYEQVRYFLGKVHEDFVTVNANNPFLGNLEKYQIRTAKYDPATDLATITTGFQQPVYSKRFYYDASDAKIKARIDLYSAYTQFDVDTDVGELVKITGSDESINGTFYIDGIDPSKSYINYTLPSSEQDIKQYTVQSAVNDATYITYTSSGHNIRAGHIVTVAGLILGTGSGVLNVSGALVVSATSTTFKVASPTAITASSLGGTTGNAYTSDRLILETRLPPNSSVITFGAHDMSAGNNFELVGLTRQNYDGVWKVDTVPDDVSFTYTPRFENLKITNVQLTYLVDSYLVKIRLARSPDFKKYAYKAGHTKITIDNLGSPYDGTFVLNEVGTDTVGGDDYHYFSYKISGAAGSRTVHPLRTFNYNERKYGTAFTISSASYVAQISSGSAKPPNKATGKGVSTFVTSAAHSFTVGQKVVIANVGGEFTQLTGVGNNWSEYIVTVSTVPTSTSFTVSNLTDDANDSLWKLKNNLVTDDDIGKANKSTTPPVGTATATAWDNSATRPDDTYPYVKIDDLPDVTSLTVLTANVTGKAFNAKQKKVYLELSSDPGFEVGQKVIVEDLDDDKNLIFDGTYTITGFSKVGNKYQLIYISGNRKYKKDIGTFDDKEVLTKYNKEYSGTAKVDAAIYVGSYGSYTQNSDIGLEFSTYADSGNYQRVPTYRGHELKTVGDYLSEYSDKYIVKPNSTKIIRNVYGFEYRIDCVYDTVNSTFKRVFKFLPINYPNAPVHGEVSPPSRFGADKYVFEYPGNISSVSLDESAEEASTRFFMVGSDGGTGTGDASKSYIGVAHKELLANNWPLLDSTESDDKLDFLRDISENAYRYLNETKPPSGVFQIGVVGNLDPIVNTYQPGDWCSIIVNDKFVQDRLASDLEPRNDVIVRKIISYSVDVPDAPSVPESVSINMITEWDVDNNGQQ
jgi:hypothetical protein